MLGKQCAFVLQKYLLLYRWTHVAGVDRLDRNASGHCLERKMPHLQTVPRVRQISIARASTPVDQVLQLV